MRVRIIANCPPDEKNSYDISEFIGQEFEVASNYGNGEYEVDFGFDTLTIYPGEYEIVR